MEGIDRNPEEEMAFRSFLVPNNQLSPVAEIDENSRSQETFSTRATGTISCKRSLYRQSAINQVFDSLNHIRINLLLSQSLFDDTDQTASDWKLDVRNYVAHLESSSLAEEVAEIRKLSEEVMSDPSDPGRWLNFLRLRAHGTADTSEVLRVAESNHSLIPSVNVMYLWAMKLSLPSASSDSFKALVHDYDQIQTESFLSVAYNLLDRSVRTRTC